jgi:hypothetical protein
MQLQLSATSEERLDPDPGAYLTCGLAPLMRASVASTAVRFEFRPLFAALQHSSTAPWSLSSAVHVLSNTAHVQQGGVHIGYPDKHDSLSWTDTPMSGPQQ